MLSKMIDSVIEMLIGDLNQKRNKRIYIILFLGVLVIASWLGINLLKLEINPKDIVFSEDFYDIINTVIGLLLTASLFLYILSMVMFIIFFVFEGVTYTICSKNRNFILITREKLGEWNSWFLKARLGTMLFSSASFDWLTIGFLSSIVFNLNHHIKVFEYANTLNLKFNVFSTFFVVIISILLLSNIFRIIQTIHYHFFHFQSEIRQ